MFVFFLMIRRPPRSTPLYSSAASDVYKRQIFGDKIHVSVENNNGYNTEAYDYVTDPDFISSIAVSYTHLRAHETVLDLVCRLLLEKKKKQKTEIDKISPAIFNYANTLNQVSYAPSNHREPMNIQH